jgi:hypothetical protein
LALWVGGTTAVDNFYIAWSHRGDVTLIAEPKIFVEPIPIWSLLQEKRLAPEVGLDPTLEKGGEPLFAEVGVRERLMGEIGVPEVERCPGHL